MNVVDLGHLPIAAAKVAFSTDNQPIFHTPVALILAQWLLMHRQQPFWPLPWCRGGLALAPRWPCLGPRAAVPWHQGGRTLGPGWPCLRTKVLVPWRGGGTTLGPGWWHLGVRVGGPWREGGGTPIAPAGLIGVPSLATRLSSRRYLPLGEFVLPICKARCLQTHHLLRTH